jgi:hypothetical protein
MQGAKATGDIFERCVGNLDGIVSKYSLLLYGKAFDSLRLQYGFEEVFTFAWKV